jgi:hypothetical protein
MGEDLDVVDGMVVAMFNWTMQVAAQNLFMMDNT